MPLVGFKATKARLIIEEDKERVLVMMVAVAKGESVDLSTGGNLQALTGVIRIRERKAGLDRRGKKPIGSLVFVPGSGDGNQRSPAKFQINISMAAKKFESLLEVAISGKLPSKFFLDAGQKVSAWRTKGIGYALRAAGRTKVWDNQSFRTLPVMSFVIILPVGVVEPQVEVSGEEAPLRPEALATNVQVAELATDLQTYAIETTTKFMIAMAVIVVIAVLVLLVNVIRVLS